MRTLLYREGTSSDINPEQKNNVVSATAMAEGGAAADTTKPLIETMSMRNVPETKILTRFN